MPLGCTVLLAGVLLAEPGPRDPYAACVQQIRDDPQSDGGYYCLFRTGVSNRDHAEARRRLERWRDVYPDSAGAQYYVASIARAMGDPNAPRLLADTADRFGAEGRHDKEVWARILLSAEASASDDAYDDQLVKALEAARRSGDEELIAVVQSYRAASVGTGDVDASAALELLAEIRGVAATSKAYALRGGYLKSKEAVMRRLNRQHEAFAAVRQRLALAEAVGDQVGAALCRVSLARDVATRPRVAAALSDEERREIIDAALGAEVGERIPRARAEVLCLQGRIAASAAEALAHFEACTAAHRQAGQHYFAGQAALWRAHAAAVAGEQSPGGAALLGSDTHAVGREGLLAAFLELDAAWRADDPSARARSVEFLDRLDLEARREADPLLRAEFTATHFDDVSYIASRLLGPHPEQAARDDVEAAIGVIERWRARALAHALARAGVSVLERVDRERRDAYRRAAAKLAATQRRFADAASMADERAAILDELQQCEAMEAEAWADVVGAVPGAMDPYGPVTLSIPALQDALAPDEALLSFQLAEPLKVPRWFGYASVSWVLVITRDAVRVFELPDRLALEARVELHSGAFARRDGSERGMGKRLYDDILADAVLAMPERVRRLIVVPDGPLHRLAFAALPTTDGSPLSRSFSVASSPSLELWLAGRDRDGASPGSALVVADPTRPEYLAIATERGVGANEDASLGPLPRAREEAQAIAAEIGDDARLRIGEDATEHYIKSADLGRFSVVHFAAHAVVDEARPERSAVVLAAGSEDEDGLLRLREIAELDLSDSAVVLASCESASGALVGGEGPIGLARAFLEARARVVVASLWRLRDDDSVAFFTIFYRHLARGRSVAESVARAQRELEAVGYPAAAWAGIVVIGDGDFRPVARPSAWGWWLGGGAIAALALAALAFGRRRRRRARFSR